MRAGIKHVQVIKNVAQTNITVNNVTMDKLQNVCERANAKKVDFGSVLIAALTCSFLQPNHAPPLATVSQGIVAGGGRMENKDVSHFVNSDRYYSNSRVNMTDQINQARAHLVTLDSSTSVYGTIGVGGSG